MSGSLPSRKAFAAQYRSLTVEERGAFIADLRAARGWETTVEGTVVVARRDGTVRRIAVGRPEGDTAVDAVVAADDELRSLAEERDVEVLEPEALREELLYGLATETGAELFGTHFDDAEIEFPEEAEAPSESREKRTPPESREQGIGALSPKFRNRRVDIGRSKTGKSGGRTNAESHGRDSEGGSDESEGVVPLALVLAVGVVFVLLFALVSGSGAVALSDLLAADDRVDTAGSDPAITDSSSGTPDGSTAGADGSTASESGGGENSQGTTEDGQDAPPSLNGTHDAERIASTHAAAVADQDAFRFRVRSEGPTRNGEIDPPRDLDVRIAGDNRFLVEEEDIGSGSGESVSLDVFADGYLEYWRFDGPAGVRYNRGSIRRAPPVTDWSGEYGADLIRTYLNASDSNIERVLVDNRTAYRVTVNSPPPALDGEAVGYRATATVVPDGTVRTLTVTYRHEPSGEEVWLRSQYDIGEREIATPIWYDRALQQFDYGP